MTPAVDLKSQVIVTPELAAEWLASNTNNRPLAKNVVARYAHTMQQGQWRYNPVEPLGFRTNGTLCQGQHRLQAIVKCGIPQTFDVCYNVPDDLFSIIDTGHGRKGSDTLAIAGEINTSALSAALAWIETEQLAREQAKAGLPYIVSRSRGKVENYRILELLTEHPELRNSAQVCQMLSPRTLIPPSIAMWLHYRMSRINAEWAETYFTDIGKGVSLKEHTPELAVRNWLVNNLATKRHARPEMQAAILIKGWNKRFTSRPWRVAAWKAEIEGFPRLEGEAW